MASDDLERHNFRSFWGGLDYYSVEPLYRWFNGFYSTVNVAPSDVVELVNATRVWHKLGYVEPTNAPLFYRAHVIYPEPKECDRFHTVGEFVQHLNGYAARGELRLTTREVLPLTPSVEVASTFARHNQAESVHADDSALRGVKSLSVIIRIPSNQVEVLISAAGIVNLIKCAPRRDLLEYFLPFRWRAMRRECVLRRRLKKAVWNFAWAQEAVCRIAGGRLEPTGVISVLAVNHLNFQQLVALDPRSD